MPTGWSSRFLPHKWTNRRAPSPHQEEQRQAHTALEVDQLESSIEEMLQQAKEEDSHRESPPTIYRVRPSIREEQPRAYDPKVVSLGPFHRGNAGLEEMEKLKRRFMNDLLARSPAKNSVTKYIKAVRQCESARAQYAGEVALGADAFLQAMVLDGCFLVECLVKSAKGELEPALDSANCNTTLLRSDCLLVENQVPFSVVEALFRASDIPWLERHHQPELWRLATHLLKIMNLPETQPTGEIYHLLHIFHRSHDPGTTPPGPPTRSCDQTMVHYLGKLNLIFYAALYSVLKCQSPELSTWAPRRDNFSNSMYPSTIPGATELRESGIRIRRRHFADPSEYCLLKVTFENGTLHIPFLSVEEATNSRFRNLVALEQCYPGVGNYFTSYAIFMDNIANTAADVAELRSCGVVGSKLGSDEEVAHMFNTLCKESHLNYDDHYLKDVFKDVNQYCETSRHRWRAKLVRAWSYYFSSPWSVISVFVAFVLLVFTGLQTAFAVMAYFRPPKQS